MELEVKIKINDKELDDFSNNELSDYIDDEKVLSLINNYLPNKIEVQEDTYYQHPCWSMIEKDKVLRNRKIVHYHFENNDWQKIQETDSITYKGEKKKSLFKLRDEFEFDVDSNLWHIFKELGFQNSTVVYKKRWESSFIEKNIQFNLCYDFVTGLGFFIEIECIIENESNQKLVEEKIIQFIQKNKLEDFQVENKSYATLLSEQK